MNSNVVKLSDYRDPDAQIETDAKFTDMILEVVEADDWKAGVDVITQDAMSRVKSVLKHTFKDYGIDLDVDSIDTMALHHSLKYLVASQFILDNE